ncbi:hypothetical protein HKX48_003166 [Thoreauomyces humboldtii]|nr:hypothetical protein HKX48_003166 [Thoreauomyces humboldtii]
MPHARQSTSKVNETVRAYNALLTPAPGSKRPLVRRAQYTFTPRTPGQVPIETPAQVTVHSFNCLDTLFKKAPSPLPTLARGLFVTRVGDEDADEWRIAARGYDKFFNVGETASTRWDNLATETIGPYEATLKENGCIIFAAALEGDLLVTSKHAMGVPKQPTKLASGAVQPSHAEKGEEWLERHLKSAGKTRWDFARFLEANNATAVFELADDDFEEHILEYPPDRRGLYLHGMNENVSEFRTWSSDRLKPVAQDFGLLLVDAITFDTVEAVREFSDACRDTGSYNGRAIEGFVIRCRQKEHMDNVFFFKIKYDEPYLMFREWREVTKKALSGKESKFKPRYELTRRYIKWVLDKARSDSKYFEDFDKNQGIIRARNQFLSDCDIPGLGEHIVAEARRTTADYARGEATMITEEDAEKSDPDNVSNKTAKPVRAEGGGRKSQNQQGKGRQPLDDGRSKTLIIPVATIGAGKTLLGRLLVHVFPSMVGHIQNDDIQAKKAAPQFEDRIMKSFAGGKDLVFADRNNHLFQHRSSLSATFLNSYPAGRVVAIDWEIEKCVKAMGFERVAELGAQRVKARGENHQSLTPSRTADIGAVIRSFIARRDALDTRSAADSNISDVLRLNLVDDPRTNFFKLVEFLHLPRPDMATYDEAYSACVDQKETVVKVVKDTSAKRKVLFYGIKLDSDPNLGTVLESTFATTDDRFRRTWGSLSSTKRIEERSRSGWHVTLVVVRSDGARAVELSKAYARRLAASSNEELGVEVSCTLTEVVWDDRVMAVVVQLPDDVQTSNDVPHVTVATRSEDVKPVVSNEVLAVAFGKGNGHGEDVVRLPFPEPVEVKGRLRAFYSR